jgi:hypothetical protein
MDPIVGKALAKAAESGTDALSKEAQGFIKSIVRPAAAEIGQTLKDQIAAYRYNNLVKIVVRAKEKVKDAKLSVSEVPLKIIHPMLEAASLEEEPNVQEMWSNLVAATSTGQVPFASAFVEIMRQLSPEEGRFIQLLAEKLIDDVNAFNALPAGHNQRHPMTRLGTFEDLRPLVTKAAWGDAVPVNEDGISFMVMSALDNICRLGILNGPTTGRSQYYMGAFGFMFVTVCCRPKPQADMS